MQSKTIFVAAIGLAVAAAAPAAAQQATVRLTLKNHKFKPAQPHAPANKPLIIVVKNLDSTPAEFESSSLRVEKVVTGGGQISIRIRPLNAGVYHFYDDFHQDTTAGNLIVK
jgi:hypothetical protein